MRRPEKEIQPHHVAHVTANNNRVFCHLNGLIAHIKHFRLGPAGQLLGTGDDYGKVLICPDLHFHFS